MRQIYEDPTRTINPENHLLDGIQKPNLVSEVVIRATQNKTQRAL